VKYFSVNALPGEHTRALLFISTKSTTLITFYAGVARPREGPLISKTTYMDFRKTSPKIWKSLVELDWRPP
jgi:hypothetical protein